MRQYMAALLAGVLALAFLPVPGSAADSTEINIMHDSRPAFAQVIGATAVTLDARKHINRLHETLLGDYIADVARQSVGADVGLVSGGNIGADRYYYPGPLSRKDIADILPFANRIVKLEVNGAALLAALENGVSQVEGGAVRFPQVSGLRFRLDVSQPPGQRVSDVMVGGKPLDPAASYTMATDSSLAGGADGYTMFQAARVLVDASAGPLLVAAVTDAVQAAGSIAPQPEGRIRMTAGVALAADRPQLAIGRAAQALDVAPGAHYATIFTPLRAVVELYGGEVEWLPSLYAAWVKMPWGSPMFIFAGPDGYLEHDRLVVPPYILQRLGINTVVRPWDIGLSI